MEGGAAGRGADQTHLDCRAPDGCRLPELGPEPGGTWLVDGVLPTGAGVVGSSLWPSATASKKDAGAGVCGGPCSSSCSSTWSKIRSSDLRLPSLPITALSDKTATLTWVPVPLPNAAMTSETASLCRFGSP